MNIEQGSNLSGGSLALNRSANNQNLTGIE